MIEENIETKVETKVEKWTRECLEQGFKFLGKSLEKPGYSIAECITCHHVDSYVQDNIRKGKIRCSKCKISQWSNECLDNGFRFIRKIDNKNSLAECLTCSHVDSYSQCTMRNGKVRCDNCLVNKYKSLVKPGWEYVDKTVIKNRTYIFLKHSCSDNTVTVDYGNFLYGKYDCPHCSQTHFDDPSYFYVIKVTHDNQSMIKIGVANNTDRRFRQYGLPDDAILEIVHIEPFSSKRLAISFESAMKQALADYKVDNEMAKNLFKDSGHTECFTDESLEYLENFFNTDLE